MNDRVNDQRTGLFFRITNEQKEILNKVAKAEERTLQAVFNRAMREYIDRYHQIKFANIEDEVESLQA